MEDARVSARLPWERDYIKVHAVKASRGRQRLQYVDHDGGPSQPRRVGTPVRMPWPARRGQAEQQTEGQRLPATPRAEPCYYRRPAVALTQLAPDWGSRRAVVERLDGSVEYVAPTRRRYEHVECSPGRRAHDERPDGSPTRFAYYERLDGSRWELRTPSSTDEDAEGPEPWPEMERQLTRESAFDDAETVGAHRSPSLLSPSPQTPYQTRKPSTRPPPRTA